MALIRTGPFLGYGQRLAGASRLRGKNPGHKYNRFRLRSTEGGAVPQVERAHG